MEIINDPGVGIFFTPGLTFFLCFRCFFVAETTDSCHNCICRQLQTATREPKQRMSVSSNSQNFEAEVDNFKDTSDNVVGYIEKLTALVEQGLIAKDKLPALIAAVVSGNKKPSQKNNAASSAIVHSRSYRKAASPETIKVRRILERPIKQRFGLQCATVDSVLFKDGLVRRLNKDLFNDALQDPLEEVYTTHAKELSKVPGEKVIHIAKWKVRKMRGNYVKKGVSVPGTYEDDGYDWEQASLRSMPGMIQVRPVPSRPGRFVRVRVKQEEQPTFPRRDIRSHIDLTTNRNRSAFSRPAMMHASNDFTTPVRKSGRRCGGECGKCIKATESFPKTVDWEHNVSATPYCEKCFADLSNKCDALAAVNGAAKKKTKKRKRTPKPVRKNLHCVCLLFVCCVCALVVTD